MVAGYDERPSVVSGSFKYREKTTIFGAIPACRMFSIMVRRTLDAPRLSGRACTTACAALPAARATKILLDFAGFCGIIAYAE